MCMKPSALVNQWRYPLLRNDKSAFNFLGTSEDRLQECKHSENLDDELQAEHAYRQAGCIYDEMQCSGIMTFETYDQ